MPTEQQIQALQERIAAGRPSTAGLSPKQAAKRERAIAQLRDRMSTRALGGLGGDGGRASVGVMSDAELKARLNQIVGSLPNQGGGNDSSWAKGLGFVGDALGLLDYGKSYVQSKVSTLATGIEEGDPTKVLGALPVVGEAVNIVDNFGGDPNAPKGALNKVLFADKQQSKDFYDQTGAGDYLERSIKKHGWEGTWIDNSWIKRLVGLAGDIGLDPLTYATFGAGAVVKGGAKAAGGALVKEGLEVAAEQGAKQLAKEGVEQGGKKVVRFAADGLSSTVKTVSDDVARATADDALRSGGKTAGKAIAGGEDLVDIAEAAGKIKPRTVRGYKAISDLYFEEARALNVGDPLRAQLEQVGANIRRARSTWVATNEELALIGGKRGVWLPGQHVLGSNSKVVESAIRAKEAVGGSARRAVSDPAAKLLEGTFGNEEQNVLRKAARSGDGSKSAVAVGALQLEQFARHRSNGMMIELARGFGQSLDVAEKNGLDINEVWRAVQDEDAFRELASRSAKAAEGVQGVRDEFRKARNMFKDATGEELPDNPFYMPRRFTPEATDFINKKPEFVSEQTGPATFTQGRTLRSGQDDAIREVDKESTVFLGERVPRNLSDAQVTDWANERYKYVFGNDAPQLFETDARKLVSSYLNEFKSQLHKDMFTRGMVRSGFGNDMARTADKVLQGTDDEVSTKLRAAISNIMGGMDANRAGTVANLDQIGAALSELDAIAKAEAKTGRTWSSMRKTMLQARKDLEKGDFDSALNRLRREANRNFAASRQSEEKLARVAQRRGERIQNAIANLERIRDERYQATIDEWAKYKVVDEARVARAGENAARITEKQWMPSYADKQAAETAGRQGREFLAPGTRQQVAADAEEAVFADSRRVASEHAAANAERVSAERQVAGQQERIYNKEWKYAEAERDLANANKEVTREMTDWVGDNPKHQALLHDMVQQNLAGKSIMDRIESGEAVDAIVADKIKEIEDVARLMGVNPSQVVPLKLSLEEAARRYAAAAARNASGAPDALDNLLIDLSVGDAQARAFNKFVFNKRVSKGMPIDAELKPGRGTLRNSKEFAQARKPVRAEAAAIAKMRQLDASGQFETMMRNMYARTVSTEGFNSLPADVQGLFKRAEENILQKGNLKSALHVYDKLNNVLKGWLLAKPGFVMRNIIGGLFMNMVDGVSVASHVRMFRAWKADVLRQQGKTGAWEKLNKRDKWVYEQVRSFLSQGDTLAASTAHGTGAPNLLGRINPASSDFFYTSSIRGFNTVAEDIVLRGSMAFDTLSRDPALMRALSNGDRTALNAALRESTARAVTRVNTFHFSYDKADKSVFENEVMARMMPFYTYTRNAIPLMVSMMIERPKYFAWANSVARNIQLGVPQDEVVPEYIREAGAIRTPFKFGGSRVYWMQDLPFNQLIDSSQDPVNFAASAFSPLLKTPVELAQGQQFYKKIPITQDMKESKFANVPLLSQALSALGAQRSGNDGQQFMRDDLQYALGQLVPPAYMVANYAPATDTQQMKWPTRVVSDTTGIRLRVNTPEDQANEEARRRIKEREAKSKQTREANRGYGDYPAGYKPRKKKQNQ